MPSDVAAMRACIKGRICETRLLAEEACARLAPPAVRKRREFDANFPVAFVHLLAVKCQPPPDLVADIPGCRCNLRAGRRIERILMRPPSAGSTEGHPGRVRRAVRPPRSMPISSNAASLATPCVWVLLSVGDHGGGNAHLALYAVAGRAEGDRKMSETTIVVGVDGSPGARVALEFAVDEAVRRRSRLRVIAVVQLPEYGLTAVASLVPPAPDELVEDVRKAAQHQVDEVLAARTDITSGLPISVEARVGRPGEVLCGTAHSADLLVIGHRGRGSVASGLLGSVGLHCVLHASSTVTVVRRSSSEPG
jgi:nucleotide-binding universal stress UspA family protein